MPVGGEARHDAVPSSEWWLERPSSSQKVAELRAAACLQGLAALLVQGLSGLSPGEIVRVPADFIAQLGLQQSLTPSRNNGFLNMFKLMQAGGKGGGGGGGGVLALLPGAWAGVPGQVPPRQVLACASAGAAVWRGAAVCCFRRACHGRSMCARLGA